MMPLLSFPVREQRGSVILTPHSEPSMPAAFRQQCAGMRRCYKMADKYHKYGWHSAPYLNSPVISPSASCKDMFTIQLKEKRVLVGFMNG